MNNDLEETGKETVEVRFKVLTSICLEVLRRMIENLKKASLRAGI